MFVVARIGFEEKPMYFVVIYEIYMDLVFAVDMIRIFNSPIFNESGKMITDRKLIAKAYLKTWLLFDIWSFYPLAYLRYNSNWEDGSRNDIQNFID